MGYLGHPQNGYHRMSAQQMAPYMAAAGGFMGGAMMGHMVPGHVGQPGAAAYGHMTGPGHVAGPGHAAHHHHHHPHHPGAPPGIPPSQEAGLQRGHHQGNMYPYGYGLVQQLNGGAMRR